MRSARFADLRSAGRALAPLLKPFITPNALVLAIVRGGAPVAREVADALSLPLDVVLLRRLFIPSGGTEPMTAAWIAGTLVMPHGLTDAMGPAAHVFLPQALDDFAARNTLCRRDRTPVDLTGRTILLVDNGARTGGTMRVVARAVRTLAPARIIAALPVANPECRAVLEACADEIVCCAWPHPFAHVGMSYANFDVPRVEHIHELLPPAYDVGQPAPFT